MWFGIKISGINGDTPLLPKPDEVSLLSCSYHVHLLSIQCSFCLWHQDQYKNMIPLKPNQTSLITTSQSLKAQLGNPKPRSPANAAD
jgi:hypothetical protein